VHNAFLPLAASASLSASTFVSTPLAKVPSSRPGVFSTAYQQQPDLPVNFRPAVVFTDCVFINNSVSTRAFSTTGGSAMAVAIDTSYALLQGCTFQQHAPYVQTSWVTHFGGAGTNTQTDTHAQTSMHAVV
jgi:hypothetical protein